MPDPSITFQQAVHAPETGEAFLTLLTLDHDTLSDPLRFTSDGVDTTAWHTVVSGLSYDDYGLSFDGSDDYVDCGSISTLDFGSGSFTIEANVRPRSTTGSYAGIVTRRGDGSDEYWQLTYHTDGKIYAHISDNSSSPNTATVSASITQDEWAWVAVVVDRTSDLLKLSVDGGQSFTTADISGVGSIGSNTDPVRIGWEKINNSYLDAIVSEVRFWDDIRTQTEIQNNTDTELDGSESNLVTYYPFKEGSGSTLYDYEDSSSDNDGTINGATWVGKGTFIAFPFQITLPVSSKDQPPKMQLAIDNVDRQIVQTIREIQSAPSIRVDIVLASTPDTIEVTLPDFILLNAQYDRLTVQGTLAIELLDREPFPAHTYNPTDFPGLF